MSYFLSDPDPMRDRIEALEAKVAELPTTQELYDAIVAAVSTLLEQLEQKADG
jgi:hypothetical protein